MIVIIDKVGTNIASLQFALERLGQQPVITSDAKKIQAASHVILPGVSTAARAMRQLAEDDLLDTLRSLTQPVLGICSGMQILFASSEEGAVDGIGIYANKVQKLPLTPGYRLPHMGWNTLHIKDTNCALLNGISEKDFVYFVHSYAVQLTDETVASAEYGVSFSAVVAQKNFFGTQFHPERSGTVGAKILQNFIAMN